ncbi:MAG TPA: hypothetical protein VN033_10870 [Vulgatibacter sp.]|nr:hypothetical protein [Vulgatibacter sp.]
MLRGLGPTPIATISHRSVIRDLVPIEAGVRAAGIANIPDTVPIEVELLGIRAGSAIPERRTGARRTVVAYVSDSIAISIQLVPIGAFFRIESAANAESRWAVVEFVEYSVLVDIGTQVLDEPVGYGCVFHGIPTRSWSPLARQFIPCAIIISIVENSSCDADDPKFPSEAVLEENRSAGVAMIDCGIFCGFMNDAINEQRIVKWVYAMCVTQPSSAYSIARLGCTSTSGNQAIGVSTISDYQRPGRKASGLTTLCFSEVSKEQWRVIRNNGGWNRSVEPRNGNVEYVATGIFGVQYRGCDRKEVVRILSERRRCQLAAVGC